MQGDVRSLRERVRDRTRSFGTLDELFEALTLIQTATVDHFPLILVGEEEWEGMIDWLRSHALADHRIDAADLTDLHVVAGPAEVVEIVTAARVRLRARAHRRRGG